VTVPVTDARTIGVNELTLKSPRMISSANMDPAIGA
jgi:hypothetical protein